MVRRHYVISGNVQGVGFRYRASYAANSLGVTGWVKNEWDGTVEMEAQGEPELLNRMFKVILHNSMVVIEDIKTQEIPVDKSEYGFHVR